MQRATFTSPLQFSPLPNGREFRLVAPLCYSSPKWGSIVVPSGFKTDLASIPKLFWNVFSPLDRHQRAAILHDYLYHHGHLKRSEADRAFREAMKVCRTPWLKRQIIYYAVRLCGRSSYRKGRKS